MRINNKIYNYNINEIICGLRNSKFYNMISNKFLWILFANLLIVILFKEFSRAFENDEFEAVHSAWKILHGEKIYVDFFQHHHPFLYYILIPILGVLGESTASIIAMRIAIFLMLLLIFVVTYFLSVKLFNRDTGIISLILLSTTMIFVDKAIEIRPDVPQTLCGLVSLFFLFTYFENKFWNDLALSSFFLGLSFLFLQKSIFLIFLIGILLIINVHQKRNSYRDFFFYFTVLFFTNFPYYLYLFYDDSLSSYFLFNWTLNAKFITQVSPLKLLLESLGYALRTNLLIWVFYFWGLLTYMKSFKQKQFAFLSLGLLVSILFVRAPYKQYFMMSIPLVASISAFTIHSILRRSKSKVFLILVLSASLFLFFSFQKLHTNYNQLKKISYVLSITTPEDLVYDGNIDFNIFRKDINFFWFSLNPKWGGLATYRTINSYEYNIYHLIDTFKPQVISDYHIDNLKDNRIINHYVPSQKASDLYIREVNSDNSVHREEARVEG